VSDPYAVPRELRHDTANAIYSWLRELRRNGRAEPSGFRGLADRLLVPDDDAMTRQREIWRNASRRYRARKRNRRVA